MKNYTVNVLTTFTLDLDVTAESVKDALEQAKNRYENIDNYGNILDVDFKAYLTDEHGNLTEQKEDDE